MLILPDIAITILLLKLSYADLCTHEILTNDLFLLLLISAQKTTLQYLYLLQSPSNYHELFCQLSNILFLLLLSLLSKLTKLRFGRGDLLLGVIMLTIIPASKFLHCWLLATLTALPFEIGHLRHKQQNYSIPFVPFLSYATLLCLHL